MAQIVELFVYIGKWGFDEGVQLFCYRVEIFFAIKKHVEFIDVFWGYISLIQSTVTRNVQFDTVPTALNKAPIVPEPDDAEVSVIPNGNA